MTPEQRVVLLDFGLATEIREHGTAVTVERAGTPQYMSPEHVRGEPLSEASDWYSVGVMLYQALTGRLPSRRREGPGEDRRPGGFHSPRDESPGVPEDLSRLCMALLADDPGRRPPVAEISAMLGDRSAPPAPRVRRAGGTSVKSHAGLTDTFSMSGKVSQVDLLARTLDVAGLRLTGYSHLLMSAPFGHLDQYLPSGPAVF